jgi:hypothetical protein
MVSGMRPPATATALAVRLVVAAGVLTATGAPAQPGRAGPLALGDIDGDGRRDAALVVERGDEGPRPRVHIALFAERGDDWDVVATIRLDDGAVVDRLRIVTGRLTATYRRHYPVDPPGRPTNEIVRSWAFADGRVHGGRPAAPGGRWRDAATARLPR